MSRGSPRKAFPANRRSTGTWTVKIVTYMRDRANQFSDQYQHNYSILATPAEGLSRQVHPHGAASSECCRASPTANITPTPITCPCITNAAPATRPKSKPPITTSPGEDHIFYVEIDGDATHNPEVIMRVVNMMDCYNIGYGSVNHNRNRCLDCGYENSVRIWRYVPNAAAST